MNLNIDTTTVLSSLVGSGLATTIVSILYHFYCENKKEKTFDMLVHINLLEKYALDCERIIESNEVAVMDGSVSVGDYNCMHIPPPPVEHLTKNLNSTTQREITSFILNMEASIKSIQNSNHNVDHPDNIRFSNEKMALEEFNNAIGYIGYSAWSEAKRLRDKNKFQYSLYGIFGNLEQRLKVITINLGTHKRENFFYLNRSNLKISSYFFFFTSKLFTFSFTGHFDIQ